MYAHTLPSDRVQSFLIRLYPSICTSEFVMDSSSHVSVMHMTAVLVLVMIDWSSDILGNSDLALQCMKCRPFDAKGRNKSPVHVDLLFWFVYSLYGTFDGGSFRSFIRDKFSTSLNGRLFIKHLSHVKSKTISSFINLSYCLIVIIFVQATCVHFSHWSQLIALLVEITPFRHLEIWAFDVTSMSV